ncbi:NAD-dependent epimerase/dehydratase family protein [Komagataeibacter sp. AV436]|uniref:NAD-dependent epimerase/dehydratase family protein n=1 Tax=Komagataeibacter melomenusus TaxID=2766578 RepID=A0ABX2ACI5_9PROT|nr:NAD-dependent epimerase/dehydratase family protein [Komagataeibacter melomenusus]MBV1830136.1 NAD-dependent epimerase/dehydratase family protein [Komagataeibacter melomenusus]NPC65557.1 NAD-dependent epimerase/dehydratase family protein [Komagataeibacter melomenusus]
MTMPGGAVVVTGDTGFVGLNVVEALLGRGRCVIGISDRALPASLTRHFPMSDGRYIHHQGDITDPAFVRACFGGRDIAAVIHLAAVTSGAAQECQRAAATVAVNLGGTVNAINAAAEAGVRNFLFASSVAVYGNDFPDGTWLKESTPRAPASLYAISKYSGEQIAARLAAQWGMTLKIGRLGRVFGPYEHETGVRDTLSQIFVATRAARTGQPVHFARPCIKNWQYARDAAAALIALSDIAQPVRQTYNMGAPTAWSLLDWCRLLRTAYPDFRFAVGPQPAPPGALSIDLWGDHDGGLLSGALFRQDVMDAPCCDMQAAFRDYMQFLHTSDTEGKCHDV